jgi:hypothetical protein
MLCRDGPFRKALSGLLVLVVLLVSVAQGRAVMLPIFDTASHAIAVGQSDEHRTTSPAHNHPCDDHDQGLACCLAGGCPILTGNLPSGQPALQPRAAVALAFLMAPTTAPDELNSPPDLPPPRYIV